MAEHDIFEQLARLRAESTRKDAEIGRVNRELESARRAIETKQQEIADLQQHLQALVTQDGLTGMKNHRAFQERLEDEIWRTYRDRLPLSIVLLDVDQFKRFNDEFGHPAGDEVLKAVARAVRVTSRVTDFVARYGGEEFGVILPNTSAEGASILAEKLRVAIAELRIRKWTVTASFGAATLGPGASTRQSLIAAADAALYRAKAMGRNRVMHAAELVAALAAGWV